MVDKLNYKKLTENTSECEVEFEDTPESAERIRKNLLRLVDINEVNKMLDEFGLPDLTPSCLMDFEPYIDNAFTCHDKAIATILSEKAKEIRDLSPKIIASILNEKLFLPYGKNNLTNPEIKSELVTGCLSLP